MGASAWDYFTSYQPDIAAALKALRDEVFASGAYQTPWMMAQGGVDEVMDQILGSAGAQEMLARMKPDERANFEDIFKQQRESLRGMNMPPQPPRPRTVDDLLEQCAESGTHSILDINEVGATRDFGKAFPMPPSIVRDLYGSEQPTRAAVEAMKHERSDELDRWECWYVIVYKNGQPSEIYFEGVSGD